MSTFDFAIVGAGIAGASLGAELSAHASVLVLEAETHPGYHATGRSAAFWEECYGGPQILPLTQASGPYLREHGFLSPRGALYIGRDQDRGALDSFVGKFADSEVTLSRFERAAVETNIPGIKPPWTGAVWEPACSDIDVAGLHAHYLKRARAGGVQLKTNARLASAERRGDTWHLTSEQGEEFRARILVNAAGAWADRVAAIAGASPLGITPLRRTVVQIRTDPLPPPDMPLVLDIGGTFYFKPQAGSLWLSPHDETPCEPCDAAAEEIDIAVAIERLSSVVDWQIEHVEHRWAGLRSFAPDRLPVYGYDPHAKGFAWFAGQGGFGIQTAPAAARFTAQLLLGLERDSMTGKLDAALYAAGRLG